MLKAIALSLLLTACSATGEKPSSNNSSMQESHDKSTATVEPIDVPREEWRKLLDEEAYHVMFEQGTERPGSCALLTEKRAGTFVCAACHLPLFEAQEKFESGTGWPSFNDPIPGHTATSTDRAHGMIRTEYHCARCGAHQGHVFDDGPPPTGLRYCNNGVALKFVPKGEALPELRGGA